ncbi:Arc family DNA-binding protein [Morganella morganii]|nr:Arc family DNA-binding protein [Morganella morganii]
MSDQDSKEFIERFTVRMPTGMREKIAKIADENGRSMNSEIVQVLQDHIDSRNGELPAYAVKDIDGIMKTFKDFLIKEYTVKISGDKDKK